MARLEIQRHKAVQETAGWEGRTDGWTSAQGGPMGHDTCPDNSRGTESKGRFYPEGSKPVGKGQGKGCELNPEKWVDRLLHVDKLPPFWAGAALGASVWR